jgi:hypothetical protein
MAQECDQCDLWHLEGVIETSKTRPLWHGSPRLPPPTGMPGSQSAAVELYGALPYFTLRMICSENLQCSGSCSEGSKCA